MVGFFKAPKPEVSQTLRNANVVRLFPQNNGAAIVAAEQQRVLQLQRKTELSDAARYEASVRALVARPNLFSAAPRPVPTPVLDNLRKLKL